MASSTQEFSDPRFEISDDTPEKIRSFLSTQVDLTDRSVCLLDAGIFWDTLSTKDKRLVVIAFNKATRTIDNATMIYQKKAILFLKWKFECPKCQVKKHAQWFAVNEFTFEVPSDDRSEPLLKSRCNCTTCRN